MPDFLFDPAQRLMIEPPGSGNTQFDFQRDVYSAWVRAVQGGQLLGYDTAILTEGGTPIGATGLFTGTTFILTNGWKIRGADHDHQLFLNGNIYSDDGVVSSPNPSFSVEVFISSSVNAQGISTGGALTGPQETALFDSRDHARAANNQTKPPPP